MSISQEIKRIDSELPSNCRLVAVSKFHPVEEILEAYNAGQRLFGENRPQELLSKVNNLPSDIEWHFIGHLQSNKIKMVVPYAALIHSIDSVKLLNEVNNYSKNISKRSRCLLEVFVAQEESKHGFSPEEIESVLLSVANSSEYSGVEICGLMGMATFTDDLDQVEREFMVLQELFVGMQRKFKDNFPNFNELSMGMSGDYHIALKHGSTLVRIGTQIFGARNYAAKP